MLQAATASVLARQTNAVWLMFMVGTDMLSCLKYLGEFQDDILTAERILQFLCGVWKRKWELLQRLWPLLLPVAGFVLFVMKTGSIVLGTQSTGCTLKPHLRAVMCVGDKENHKPVLHFAMLAHALFLIAAVTAPIAMWEWVSTTPSAVARSKRTSGDAPPQWTTLVAYGLLGLGAAYALAFKSYSHPFLLSDNRYVES
jgi:hypothetical protein